MMAKPSSAVITRPQREIAEGLGVASCRADIDWLRVGAVYLLFLFHTGKVSTRRRSTRSRTPIPHRHWTSSRASSTSGTCPFSSP